LYAANATWFISDHKIDMSLSAHADSIIKVLGVNPLPGTQGLYLRTCSESYIKGFNVAIRMANVSFLLSTNLTVIERQIQDVAIAA